MADPVAAWSKSSLSTLLSGCSWQFALEKVHGLPSTGSVYTALGTSYHAAVELHERIRILKVRDGVPIELPDPERMHAYAGGVLTRECAELPENQWELHGIDGPADLLAMLGTAVHHWYETPIPGGEGTLRDRIMRWRPVAVEPYFNVNAGPGRVHGYIDWLGYDHDESEWVVIDHKSAGGLSRWPHDGAGHELEATVYVVGSEIARSLPVSGPVRQEWHIARREEGKNSRFEGVRVAQMKVEHGHRLYLDHQLEEATRRVEADEFEPNPDWNLCSPKWCGFWEQGCEGGTGHLTPMGMRAAQAAS